MDAIGVLDDTNDTNHMDCVFSGHLILLSLRIFIIMQYKTIFFETIGNTPMVKLNKVW